MIKKIEKTWLCDLCRVTESIQQNDQKPPTWRIVLTATKPIIVCTVCDLDCATYKQLNDAAIPPED